MEITIDNSFTTLAEAEAYIATKLNTSVWENTTPDKKAISLIEATRKIKAIPLIDFSTVTQDFKDATTEEALAILEFSGSVHLKNQSLGIKSISLSGDSVSYGNSGDLLSRQALNLVRKYKQVGNIV